MNGSTQTENKTFESLRARAALSGVVVQKVQGEGEVFIASRWNLSKTFDDLTALEAWLDRVGGCAR